MFLNVFFSERLIFEIKKKTRNIEGKNNLNVCIAITIIRQLTLKHAQRNTVLNTVKLKVSLDLMILHHFSGFMFC